MENQTSAPYIISWNLTKRCNLKCAHCYLDSSDITGLNDINTDDILKTIDKLSAFSPGAMLILTGGEPLLRNDIYDIIAKAREKGFFPVLGTNGTLLDNTTALKLKSSGLAGVGISMDSLNAKTHDSFRGMSGAFEKTLSGIDSLKQAGLPFHVQFTVTKENRTEIRQIAEFAAKERAQAINYFFLVCTGRGEKSVDLSPTEYDESLTEISALSQELENKIMVRVRCAPHYARFSKSTSSAFTSGCIAARGYMRISPELYATPCPYMPTDEKTSLNLKSTSFENIWESPLFKSLRSPVYNGKCSTCEHTESCGGCRARSLASGNGLLGEDPWCSLDEISGKSQTETFYPQWREDARVRLQNAPIFLRALIKRGVEAYAVKNNIREITPELMAELRKKFDGKYGKKPE